MKQRRGSETESGSRAGAGRRKRVDDGGNKRHSGAIQVWSHPDFHFLYPSGTSSTFLNTKYPRPVRLDLMRFIPVPNWEQIERILDQKR